MLGGVLGDAIGAALVPSRDTVLDPALEGIAGCRARYTACYLVGSVT